ncbi:nitrogen regulation protein NR(I) [Rhodanobacter thiooxydans]|uniref:DNA-binding transcriptional regulator NtrC n=1 Tax=Rhodanobacter thiooxydans TaxID=416169 RepID=A0A154QKW1_9GAMM|nr:nitrogen regulation protein NR(I) [Rhodanobacter thiooxydans]EIL97923.1 nitrogen regulation protein NR(I) [Rhodanobacter thiooxydans LCS2]KZC24835.1 nitrogen regulation protein NR(I) [Rhodanobacter thiooxydans]MCW0203069.1 nitrogen regulation protein NR(I) [Rhodanobacter thiooxydans]
MTDEIWILDDDRGVRFVLAEALRDAGLAVREFDAVGAVRAALREARPALLLTDVRMPGEDGLGLLGELQAQGIGPVIVMSAYTDVATTAAAYRAGAVDYLAKPFDLDQAVAAVQRALASVATPTVPAGPALAPNHALLGESAPMREVFRLIGRVAASDLNVLVTGETGTGKELVARALHEESARRDKPFVALNTAAIPSELLESELFGHEAGAFTGATRRVAGRFEQAEGGTLFLDEIGDMPLILQTRLLRVLAGGEFYRVGGRELIRCNVRIVAATHQDLAARVVAGAFRADLMHRLDVVRIHLPALRERRSDIPLLARHFLAATAQELKLPPKRYSKAALKLVAQRDYPGNVRELENLCRRLAVIAPGSEILPADLGSNTDAARGGEWTDALREWAAQALADGEADIHARARAALDQTLLQAALQVHQGHRQNAALALGVGRNTLTRKLGASRTRRG